MSPDCSTYTVPKRLCSILSTIQLELASELRACFRIGVSLYCFSMFVTGYQERLSIKPQSLLKLVGWSLVSIFSFITRSIYPVALSRMEMQLKSILRSVSYLCSATANFSGWTRHIYLTFLTCGFNGSASLSNVDFAALTRHTVYTSDFYTQLVIYRS